MASIIIDEIIDESLLLNAIEYCSNEEIKSELKKSLYDVQIRKEIQEKYLNEIEELTK